MDKMSRGEMQMKLYENGVYLVNGSELIEDAPSAAEEILSKTGKSITKEEAAKKAEAENAANTPQVNEGERIAEDGSVEAVPAIPEQ